MRIVAKLNIIRKSHKIPVSYYDNLTVHGDVMKKLSFYSVFLYTLSCIFLSSPSASQSMDKNKWLNKTIETVSGLLQSNKLNIKKEETLILHLYVNNNGVVKLNKITNETATQKTLNHVIQIFGKSIQLPPRPKDIAGNITVPVSYNPNVSTKKHPWVTGTYGCTNALKRWGKEASHIKFAAFAKRRAFTVTGMRGCGFSWGQKSQSEADAVALRNCQKNTDSPDKCYISHRTAIH